MRLFRSGIFFGFIIIVLASCQKEYSFEGGIPPPPSSKGLLIKSTQTNPLSGVELYLDYNTSGLLIENSLVATAAGINIESRSLVTRNPSGSISHVSNSIYAPVAGVRDTLDYKPLRNASGLLTGAIFTSRDTAGSSSHDSLVYSYNTAGKITGFVTYLVPNGGNTIVPVQRVVLTYLGDDVIKSEEFDVSGSLANQTLAETITYEYDTKPVSYVLTNEEFAFGLFTLNISVPAIHNITQRISKKENGTGVITTDQFVYTYGADGKPVSAVVTTLVTGLPASSSDMTFTYQ